ncbi:MAG: signal peptidase II [Pygmaiobacter sp.]|nr:signal peptidase II [Pygmaiobacter sp.]
MLFTVISILAMVGLDQLTKYWATLALAPDKVAPFLPGIMEFRYILNDGAAFRMFSGRSWGQWLLVGVTTAALLVVLYILLFRRNKLQPLAYAGLLLIEAGGIGNLIDRIANGYVVDFFATTFINFAVFNVADCFVTIGVALLVIYYLRSEIEQKKQKEAVVETTARGLEPEKSATEEQGEHHVQ